MKIYKKILLTTLSFISLGLLSNNAFAYGAVYGNDYANINAININDNDFKKDNIIQKNGNQTSINVPKPQGKVNVNILGNKKTINLGKITTDKKAEKRKRYYNIQKRKKNIRLAKEREQKAINEKKKLELKAIQAKKAEAAAIAEAKKQQKAQREIEETNAQIQDNGFLPSGIPQGIPNY